MGLSTSQIPMWQQSQRKRNILIHQMQWHRSHSYIKHTNIQREAETIHTPNDTVHTVWMMLMVGNFDNEAAEASDDDDDVALMMIILMMIILMMMTTTIQFAESCHRYYLSKDHLICSLADWSTCKRRTPSCYYHLGFFPVGGGEQIDKTVIKVCTLSMCVLSLHALSWRVSVCVCCQCLHYHLVNLCVVSVCIITNN